MINLYYEGELTKFLKDMFVQPFYRRVESPLKAHYILIAQPAGKGTLEADLKQLQRVQRMAVQHKTPYLIFFIDDVEDYFPRGYGFTFRTSLTKSEGFGSFCMPSFRYDRGEALPPVKGDSIGFCGYLTHPVREELTTALRSRFETDFIIRDKWYGFYSPEQKRQYKREFIENMRNNPYQLCVRGAGNFSHRLYETLMYGRIPVLLDTDSPLPCTDEIDWDSFLIHSDSIEGLIHELKDVIGTDTHLAQRRSRMIWESYFTPEKWGEYLHRYLNKAIII